MFWQQWHMFVFPKSSNITRIRYTVKISFKMHKQGRHSDKGSPLIMLYLSIFFSSLLSSFLAFRNIVLDWYFWNFVSHSQICVVILNLPEFIIKSHCLLLAVPRDSPNCEKHNEENTSHGREYDVRMQRSTRRNLVRTSNSRRKLGRVNFRKDFWNCYKRQGKNDQKWPRWWARPHLRDSPKKKLREIFRT